MNEPAESRDLKELHRPSAIRRRLAERRRHSHLGDAVLGGIDGCVTTFAVVAGAAGGGLSDTAVVVLGCANLLADGFSMAASNYLSVKSRREELHKARREEESHIARIPRGEREEVRQIFRRKGFNGAVLEKIVEVITRDETLWVDTMLTEERGLQIEERRPLLAGLATFGAFAAAGSMPLLPFLFPGFPKSGELAASAGITAVAFLAIGVAKGLVLRAPLLRSGIETLAVGGTAAALAYAAGHVIRGMYG